MSRVSVNKGFSYSQPASTAMNENGTVSKQISRSTSHTFPGVSILRAVFDSGVAVMRTTDSYQDITRMSDLHRSQHKTIAARLHDGTTETENGVDTLNEHSKPIFKSKSLDVLSKVLSQQRKEIAEESLIKIEEEVKRIRQESSQQIQHLSQQIERLEKITKEQADRITHMLSGSGQVKRHMYSSLLSRSYDSNIYDDTSYSSYSTAFSNARNSEAIEANSFRASEFREKFKVPVVPTSNGYTNNSNWKGIVREAEYRTQQLSKHNSIYVRNITDDASDTINSSEDLLEYQTTKSVSDLREYFETAARNKSRSKSFSGFDDLKKFTVFTVASQNGELRTESWPYKSTDDTSNTIHSSEDPLEYQTTKSVSDLREYFETAARNKPRSKSFSGFDDLRQLKVFTVTPQVEELRREPSMDGESQADSTEDISFYNVSELRARFESGFDNPRSDSLNSLRN